MKTKRFLLGLILNKRQRAMIWDSLEFSRHTYQRRNNSEGQAAVQTVMNETEEIINIVKQKYTKDEVVSLIDQITDKAKAMTSKFVEEGTISAFKDGFKKGYRSKSLEEAKSQKEFEEFLNHISESMAAPTAEDCEKCDDKNSCVVYKDMLAEIIKKHSGEKEPEAAEAKLEEK